MGEDQPSQTFLAETLQVYEDIYASHVSKTAVDSAADGSNLGLYHTHMKMFLCHQSPQISTEIMVLTLKSIPNGSLRYYTKSCTVSRFDIYA